MSSHPRKRRSKSPDKPRKRQNIEKKGNNVEKKGKNVEKKDKGHASMRINGPLPGLPPLTQSSLIPPLPGQDDSDVSSLSDWNGIEESQHLIHNKKAVPERGDVTLPPEIEKTLEDAHKDIRSHMLSLAEQDQRYVNWDRMWDEMSNISTEVRVASIRMGVLNRKLMQLQGQRNRDSEILQQILDHLTTERDQASNSLGDEHEADSKGENEGEQ